MKIIDYMVEQLVIDGWDKDYLSDRVKERIKEGWQPIGGLVIDGRYTYQAMVKYGADIPKDGHW